MTQRAFLCSYPKAGRTWLRFMLAHLLARAFAPGRPVDYHTLFTFIPNMGPDPRRGTPAYAFYDRPGVPLVIADHARFHPRFRRWPVVLLLRSVYDVLASHYFHAARRMRAFEGPPAAFVRDAHWGVRPLVAYLNGWAGALDGLAAHVVTYEEMHRDPAGVLAGVAAFLGLPAAPDAVAAAVEASSFERLRRLELAGGFPGPYGPAGRADDGALRAREGRVGGHRRHLAPADVAYVRDACRDGLTPAAAALLTRHGLAV